MAGENGHAVVRLDWDGAQKSWLMTAYEEEVSPAAIEGRIGVPNRAESASPANQVAGLRTNPNTQRSPRSRLISIMKRAGDRTTIDTANIEDAGDTARRTTGPQQKCQHAHWF